MNRKKLERANQYYDRAVARFLSYQFFGAKDLYLKALKLYKALPHTEKKQVSCLISAGVILSDIIVDDINLSVVQIGG